MGNYSLKDVVVGLKGEYDNYKSKLESLKESIIINDFSLIEKSNLYVNETWDMSKPALIFDFYKKLNRLEELYLKLSKTSNMKRIIVKGNDSYQYGKLNISFTSNDFINKYHTLMTSDFVKNIYIWNINNNIGSLNINHNNIRFYSFKDKINFEIDLVNNRTNFSSKSIFNIEFEKDKFPLYHQNMIESNKGNIDMRDHKLILKK